MPKGAAGERPHGSAARSVSLPEAPPGDYLRWVAYWRDVESAMLANRRVERVASREAAPFLEGDLARFISQLAGEIAAQARAAADRGQAVVGPVIELGEDPTARASIADHIARRAEWLETHGEALGIEPLEPALQRLRSSVLRTLLE